MTELRIGVLRSPRELVIRTKKSAEEIVKQIEDAVSQATGMLWLEDQDGKKAGIATDRIAYVEILPEDSGRPVGFSLAASMPDGDSGESDE